MVSLVPLDGSIVTPLTLGAPRESITMPVLQDSDLHAA